MRYINGCTFGFMSPRGFTQRDGWKQSLRQMVASTGCDTVILPVAALQDHTFSTQVDYLTPDVMSMEDVRAVAQEVRSLGLHLILKAMVNCRDGYWRAYIRFFDTYVPTEPTWEQWFRSYDAFVVALAQTAQQVQAEMLCLGCEMVGTDHREQEWRQLIAQVRQVYTGPLTYNCDKFQEHHVSWWDAVDVISSSGYYPIDQLEEHFLRVEQVAEKFNRPFFFMESGCPSREGSEMVPNNWNYGGQQSNQAQARWYEAYTQALLRHPKIRGSVWWDWSATRLYPYEHGATNNGYCVYGKPAEKILQAYSQAIAQREGHRKEGTPMLATELKQHLIHKILPFWENLADPDNGGFYGFVDKELNVHKQAHKGCILNSRTLWSFATAARVLQDESYLPYAKRAYDFMDKFADKENGGVYWSVTAEGEPLDKTKHTYCQAFAIYGLAAYARATGLAEPLDKAMALFHLIESRCKDEGGYGEAYKADFSPESNEKLSENGVMATRTMNTLLHVLEAYAELYRACGSKEVRQAGVKCLECFLHVMYSKDKHRLEVFFDGEYKPLLDMQSFGHDIEASWLMWDAVECLISPAEQEPYKAMCIDLADAVYTRAMTDHGLKNEMVDGVVDELRIWWVQAETMLGFANAYDLTDEERYQAAVRTQWETIQRMIVDPRPNGEWYWSVYEDGRMTERPMVEEWKCPYHNSRMCLRLIEQGKE